jgi:hypothetical protein
MWLIIWLLVVDPTNTFNGPLHVDPFPIPSILDIFQHSFLYTLGLPALLHISYRVLRFRMTKRTLHFKNSEIKLSFVKETEPRGSSNDNSVQARSHF